ncbi:hypothetical protein A9Q86_13940 [Flavobacteriales bacterium 33_180_T64]|nr:hypothetical protein A9Q86_13940 [Flavobacteriales bacterium 33_180_T64]
MKKYFYVLVFAMVSFSCNNDDDALQNNEPSLNGVWSLVNVSGGFAGVDDDFAVGVITWDFNQEDTQVTITNNNTVNVVHDGFSTGVYDYEIMIVEDVSTIVIENFDFVITTLTTSNLMLDEGVVADGFLLALSR